MGNDRPAIAERMTTPRLQQGQVGVVAAIERQLANGTLADKIAQLPRLRVDENICATVSVPSTSLLTSMTTSTTDASPSRSTMP